MRMKGLLVVAAIFLAVFTTASAGVVSLNDETFDSVVDGSKGVFVKFFAPWCGHCKHLAPEYEKVAEAFARETSILIAEVDCDAHAALCQKFNVRGYPTLKFFAKNQQAEPVEYDGGRDAEEIVRWINENAGSRARLGAATDYVVKLDDSNFESIVMDTNKHVFVKFFAPWCGHCKHLAPKWSELAKIMSRESDVVIAEYDADEHKAFAEKYEIHGFPTLIAFSKSNKKGETYTGAREVSDLLTYVNWNAGKSRSITGGLNENAGQVNEMAEYIVKFMATPSAEVIEEAAKKVSDLKEESRPAAELYIKMMRKVLANPDFVEKELARLDRLLSSKSVSGKQVDDFTIRKNVLKQFSNANNLNAEADRLLMEGERED